MLNKIFTHLSMIALVVLFMGALAPPAMALSFDFLNDAGTAEKIGVITAAVIALGAALSTIFPSLPENPVFRMLMRVVTYAGLNFGKAKNLDEDPPPPSFPI